MLLVAGAELSSVRRAAGGALEIRVFNPGGTPTNVEVRRSAAGSDDLRAPDATLRGQLVDLRGRYVASFEGSFELGPYRIATARLAER
jgi:DNA/RNA endonuclease YhcR with UshA esterase domain